MDEGMKPKSKFDERLDKIKDDFDSYYQYNFPDKPSGSSSKRGIPSTHGDTNSDSKGRRPKASCVETSSELPSHAIHGFENEILFLKNFILKQKETEGLKMLAVVGKYGVGKTTLCQSVFNEEDVKDVYFPRIWVSMYSHETKEGEDSKIAVVKRILTSLGIEDKIITDIEEEKFKRKEKAGGKKEDRDTEKELSNLLYVLHSNLIGKKYLIILDDVWEDNKWDQRLDDEKNQHEKPHLSRGFPEGCGGRVIVTSRDCTLAKKIVGEEENLLRLFPRSDAGSVWKIYNDAAKAEFGEDVNPRYPGRFRQELMDKSCGIPLAARMLGKIKPEKVEEAGADMGKKSEKVKEAGADTGKKPEKAEEAGAYTDKK